MTDETDRSESAAAELGADEVEISSVRWYRRIKDWLWGYDFFISYHWASGGTYAVDLATQLREKGYEVFLDRAEYAMGDKWKGVGEVALRNTQRLVLVATREAVFESEPVAREVVLFTDRSRQCIPIFFGDTFADEEKANPGKFVVLDRLPDDTLHIEEDIKNLPKGPTPKVVENLAAARGIMRRRKLRTTITVIAISLLSTFLLVAVVAGFIARIQRDEAIRQRNVSEARRLATVSKVNAAEQTDLAILLALESLNTSDTEEGWEALFTALSQPVLARSPLISHDVSVNRVLFSPDGSVLATMGGDGIVGLWDHADPATARQTVKLEGHGRDGRNSQIWEAAFSPDGSVLATPGNDWTVRLWDVKTGEPLGELKGHKGALWDVAFSRDGELLATASADSTVRLWNLIERRAPRHVETIGTTEDGNEVWEVTFSTDGSRLMWVSADGSLRARAVVAAASEVEELLTGHVEWTKGSTAPGVAFSNDRTKLAVGSGDWTVQLWDLTSDDSRQSPAELVGHDGFVVDLAFSPDDTRLASASQDRSVRMWDVAASQQVGRTLTGHDSHVLGVGFSPDGKLLASGSSDRSVRLWDLGGGGCVGRQLHHGSSILALCVSPDGSRVASAGEGSKITVWDVASGERCDIVDGHGNGPVFSLAFNTNAKLLASAGGDGTVRLWNAESGRPAGGPLAGHRGPIRVAEFSPDGALLASAGFDRTVRLWDLGSGKEVASLENHRSLALAFSTDGTMLASAGRDATVRLWEIRRDTLGSWQAAQLGEDLAGHEEMVLDVRFGPDGMHLLSASLDGVVLRWDLRNRSADAEELLNAANVLNATEVEWTTAAFGETIVDERGRSVGPVVASASPDGSVRLWNLASGTRAGVVLLGHSKRVERLEFNRDGSLVVSASQDRNVRTWPVQSLWPDLARAAVGRDLSAEERNDFINAGR